MEPTLICAILARHGVSDPNPQLPLTLTPSLIPPPTLALSSNPDPNPKPHPSPDQCADPCPNPNPDQARFHVLGCEKVEGFDAVAKGEKVE